MYRELSDLTMIECVWLMEYMNMQYCTAEYDCELYTTVELARKFGKGETAATIGPLTFNVGAPPFARVRASVLAFVVDCVLSYAACVYNGQEIIDIVCSHKGALAIQGAIDRSMRC